MDDQPAIPTAHLARLEARAGYQIFLLVLRQADEPDRLPGAALASAILEGSVWGRREAFDTAVGELAYFRLDQIAATTEAVHAFVEEAPRYREALRDEFRRIDVIMHEQGPARDGMLAWVTGEDDATRLRPWLGAFAASEQEAAWEARFAAALARDLGRPQAPAVPTADQARSEVAAVYRYCGITAMPVDPTAESLPGRPLANAIFRAAEHGLDATLHFALETAVGFRLRATPGYAERSQAYLEGAAAYLEAFEAELRRLDSAVRAGGSRSEAAWVEIKAVTRQELAVWRQAFEQADLHSEWQAALQEQAARDAQRGAK
jgi:hypothetical protein